MNPRTRKMIVTGTLVVLMIITVLGAALPALADTTLDAKVARSTGLAADTAAGTWWTSDESGAIQLVGADGASRGSLQLDVSPESVQGLALRGGRLFVGDVGDPDQGRQAVDVYAVEAPSTGTATTTKYELVYPDGPHDAAAMTVSPNGRIYVITRGAQTGIYRTSKNPTPGGVTNQLTRIGDAPAWVSDAVYTADGTQLVLRTTNSVVVLDGNSFQQVAAAKLPETATGEALALAASGTGLVAANQASPVQLVQVPLPTTLAAVGTAPSPQPVGAASPSPSASASPAAGQASGLGASRSGTFWALAAAGVLSLLAASVVALKR